MTAIAASFAVKFAGVAISPGDNRYDEARAIWNGMVDARPALIARCRTADDIVAAVNLTREGGLPLAVRGGATVWRA
jgi:FAD/FMN-containing dehydrogenase